MRDEYQRGQILIMAALGMVALLGFAAIAMDLGHGYTKRRLAQNAADASAVAAARLVRVSDPSTAGSVIQAEIQRVAELNSPSQVLTIEAEFLGLGGESLGAVATYAGSLDNVAGVAVKVYITFDTLFAGIIGKHQMTASALATAMSLEVSASGDSGLRPIAVPNGNYNVGEEYTIWDSDKEAPGNAGWLSFDGSVNAPNLANTIEQGFPYPGSGGFHYWDDGPSAGDYHTDSPDLPIPCWVQGDPGLSNANSVHSALIDLMNDQTPITIVLYDNIEETGSNARYRIVGLAQFVITELNLNGNPKTVKGEFIRWVTRAESTGGYTTSSFSTVKLVPNAAPTPVPTSTATP